MLIQVETHTTNPHQPVTLCVGHGPHALAMTLHNHEGVGFDLTYPFTGQRSTTRVGGHPGLPANQARHLMTPTSGFAYI